MLFSKAANLFLFIFVAKLLSPQDFGSIIYYSTIVSLVTLVADFGTIQWYQKEVSLLSLKHKAINKLLSARLLSLFISILITGIYLFLSQRFSLFVSSVLLISLLPEALLSVFDAFYLENKDPKRISIKQIARSLILVAFVLLFSKNLTIEIFSIALLIAASLNVFWFIPFNYLKKYKFKLFEAVKTLKSSSKYAILITTSYAYSRGDSIIIENTLGSASLGIYSAAYRYLEGISMLPNAIAQNLFHIAAKKNNLKKGQLLKIIAVMGLFGLISSIFIFITADLLTTSILGTDYQLSSVVLRIFSLISFLFFINAPLSSIVQSSDYIKKFIPWGITNTVLNLVLNIALIPKYGLLSAAWIMLFTEISGLIINLVFVKRIYK